MHDQGKEKGGKLRSDGGFVVAVGRQEGGAKAALGCLLLLGRTRGKRGVEIEQERQCMREMKWQQGGAQWWLRRGCLVVEMAAVFGCTMPREGEGK